jgi:hypothetical protein
MMSFVVAAVVLIAQHPEMPPGMSHEEHLKEMQKESALKSRGADAMGFDQDATAHHFRVAANGGSIEVTVKDAADGRTIAAVRGHLREIAGAFADGRFDKPYRTHGEVPPGVVEMRRNRQRIAYRYEDLPQGGAVRIETDDARARDAVHAFLRYQITEHRTGDPLHGK